MGKLFYAKALRELKIRQCRESFWEFCKVMGPTLNNGNKLYRDDVYYLKELANTLQDLVENKLLLKSGKPADGICISLPPRHGKSLTVNLLVQWYLGKHANQRILNISYSQSLVNQFSRKVRNTIKKKEEGTLENISYYDIFPHLEVSLDQSATVKWALKNTTHDYTFVTASFRTMVTGLGFELGILDDPIKNSEEAMNQKELEKKWELFTGTFVSRVESGGKWIIIQTRWSGDDIIGKLIKNEAWNDSFYFTEIKVKDDEGNLLNSDIFNETDYRKAKSIISDAIFEANYNQEIIDEKFLLYEKIKFWDNLPIGRDKRVAIFDPAGDGDDYATIVVGDYFKKENKIYLVDIFYDKREYNIIQDNIIDFIIKNNINELIVESNGGFNIFKPILDKELKRKGHFGCNVIKFVQGSNKEARIKSYSNAVQEEILWMPYASTKHAEAFNHFKNFRSTIKNNDHDDIEDAITLLWEKYLNIYDTGRKAEAKALPVGFRI